MKIHRQSPFQARIDKHDEIVGVRDRLLHSAATDTQCPVCEAHGGRECKGLPPLTVHLERQEASL